MTAQPVRSPCSVPAVDVLRLRAWARATLFAAGELDLHTAVDVLAAYAAVTGIDPDIAQEIMATEFGKARG